MKKIFIAILALIIALGMCLSLSSCQTDEDNNANEANKTDEVEENSGSSAPTEYDASIRLALKMAELYYENMFKDYENYDDATAKVEIAHTRVILMKDSPTFESELYEKMYNNHFKDVEYIVEFTVLTDYPSNYGYIISGVPTYQVVFYKDGTTKAYGNVSVFKIVSAQYYTHDFSWIIDKTVNFGSEYNATFNFK